MKLPLFMILPFLLKAFTVANTNNENMPAINIADDEIICHYFSVPLFAYLKPADFNYLGPNNNKAFIIKKRAEYSCAIQLKFVPYDRVISMGMLIPPLLNYEIFYLTVIRKEYCNNNDAIVFCDNQSFCDKSKKVICCDDNYCNNYNNINIDNSLYLFDQQKFLNRTTDVFCSSLPYTAYNVLTLSRNLYKISKTDRQNATCSIIALKKPTHLGDNTLQKINITDDEIICKYCAFPLQFKKSNYDADYRDKCDSTAFTINKKSDYSCALQIIQTPYLSFRLAGARATIQYRSFLLGAIERKKCNPGNYSLFCTYIKRCNKEKPNICCDGDNCNDYNNIIFYKDRYLFDQKRFLNNISNEHACISAYPDKNKNRQCVLMKFNTTKIKYLSTLQDQNKQQDQKQETCDCNKQTNLATSYATFLILTFYSFLSNN